MGLFPFHQKYYLNDHSFNFFKTFYNYYILLKKARLKLEINHAVFWISAALIVLFVIFTLCNHTFVKQTAETVQAFIANRFGWFLILTANVILIFVIIVLSSKYGSIRIGGADAKPDFNYWAWLSMLFSAGMGIGLLFYSVAEPIFHFTAPPFETHGNASSAKLAMAFTFFHWGFHAWGIYAMIALSMAFFAYNKKLPLSIRSVFYPILGERIYGPIGNFIDILAVFSTLFGLATSLGLGAEQVNAGLNHVFGIPFSIVSQFILIGGITGLATISVVMGLDKGISRLSQLNIILAIILLAFVFFVGPTFHILDAFVENVGTYVSEFAMMSSWTESYTGTNWQNSWTLFYWAWWIAWSPFVGIFIARISKGRTVREFLLCVMLIPVFFTFVWMTVFGNAAISEELIEAGSISNAVNENVAVAIYALFDRFPLSSITSFIAIIVVISFFVTSSDSASFVVDIITSGGKLNPPVVQRIFWALMEGVLAAVLLMAGGLKALQTAVIATGLPFAIVLLFMCYCLFKGLKEEASVK